MSTLGGLPADPPAPATRTARPGWRDPRLWVGVVIVVVSVVAGARLLGSADESVAVWAARGELAVGSEVTADDLVLRRVRFVDDRDLRRYLPADAALPAGARLVRGIGEGELVPRAALGDGAASGLLHLPLAVDPSLVPRSVAAGSVVSVYVRDTGPCRECGGVALDGVTVVDAPGVDDLSGARQVVVAVDQQQADDWFALLAGLEAPVVTVTGG